MMIAGQREEAHEKRNLIHRRMERWIRLQEFVYGLPDDYSYAVCIREVGSGVCESRALVKVGWMSWFGQGKGSDRQHSLAVALLETSEALSSNSTTVFFHGIRRWFRNLFGVLRFSSTISPKVKATPKPFEEDRLAG